MNYSANGNIVRKPDAGFYNSGSSTKEMYYLYNDIQGSLVAVANASGAIIRRFSYDPWGRRRNSDNYSDTASPPIRFSHAVTPDTNI